MVGDDADQLADLTTADHLVHRTHVGQEPGPHRLHDEDPRGRGGVEHLLGLVRVAREGLLDQHVLAGGDGEPGVREVRGVR